MRPVVKHMARQARWKGNPRFYSTYYDESLNKVFVKIGATTKRATMQRRLFAKYKGWVAHQLGKIFSWW